MTSLVLDASAAVDAVLPTPRHDGALRAMSGHDLYAPHIVDLEVLSAIARLERAGEIAADDADRAVANWQDLPLTRIDSALIADSAWQLRHRVRISDAFYLATARGLAAALLTSDARLSRAPIDDVTLTVLR